MDAISKVKSVDELVKVADQLISLLPRGTNAFSVFRTQLQANFHTRQPKSGGPLLIFASAGAGVAALLFVFLAVVRLRKKTFWLARIVRANSERYLLLHYQNAWMLLCLCLLLCLQGYIWTLYRTDYGQYTQGLMLWVSLCWVPGVIAEVVACWTLFTTYALHVKTYRPGGRTAFPFHLSSTFIASTAFLATGGYLGTIVTCANLSHNYSTAMYAAYAKVDTILARGEASYNGTVDMTTFGQAAVPLLNVVHDSQNLQKWFRTTFIVTGAFSIAFGLFFLLASIVYIRALRKSLFEFSGKSTTGTAMFSRTLRGLMAITASYVLFIFLVSANAVWVAVLAPHFLREGLYRELSAVIPTLTVVFGSLLVGGVMLYQTFTSRTHFTSSPSTPVVPKVSVSPLTTNINTRLSVAAPPPLAHHLTHFALAAQEPLTNLSFAYTPDVALHAKETPFGDLELQETDTRHSASDVGVQRVPSTRRHGRAAHVESAEGIAVERQEVTVVTLGWKDASEAEVEEDEKW
ncbi:hypothetical protein JCM8547_007201 [Rhodosporidiobolus lusitaniae]